ncbi:MAG TPA: hypothetical protein VLK84_11430 [Longimicrobium sp.]|nr:hypothetical protein [Longimicrobium sp.]
MKGGRPPGAGGFRARLSAFVRGRWRDAVPVATTARRGILAGVADAGFTSLASFAAGLFAIRALDAPALGGYALVFTAFNLLIVLPNQLLFVPAEAAAASFPPGERAGVVPHTLRAGIPAALVGAALLPAWILAAPRGIPASAATALTVTAALCAIISPLQDHLRRMLHVAGRSAAAMQVSAIHLAVVVSAVAAGLHLERHREWVPFGALAAANLVSLAAGLFFLRGAGKARRHDPGLGMRALARQGRWLVMASLIGPASAFVVAAVVGHLAGVAALGLAESARVIGGPVTVLATGLWAVLGPRSIRAARARMDGEASRVATRFHVMVMTAGGLYLAWMGFRWVLNPLAVLVPRPYVVPGLAAAAILAAILHGGVFARRSELVGLERTRTIARIDFMGAAVRVALSASAALVGPFALAIAMAGQAVFRRTAYRLALRDAYRAPHAGRSDAGEAPPSVDRMAESA